jgi:hypothetical protein
VGVYYDTEVVKVIRGMIGQPNCSASQSRTEASKQRYFQQ